MRSYIDRVRCGQCDACLVLESDSVTIQTYRDRPSLRHFWVFCAFCGTDKLYWPTDQQLLLAAALDCAVVTGDGPGHEVLVSYEAGASSTKQSVGEPAGGATEVAFLVNMLAALSGVEAPPTPPPSYLPWHWSN